MRGEHLIGILTVTQLNDFLMTPQPFPGHSQRGRFGPGPHLRKLRRRGGGGRAGPPAQVPRALAPPRPLPQLAGPAPPPWRTRPPAAPAQLAPKHVRGGRQGLSAVRRAPGTILWRVLSPKSPRTALHQLPVTNRLGRGARARWPVRLMHAPRACASEVTRRERAFVGDAQLRTRTSCSLIGKLRGDLFLLVPRILNPYPPLAWCEKLLLAIFTFFSFSFPPTSFARPSNHLIQCILFVFC